MLQHRQIIKKAKKLGMEVIDISHETHSPFVLIKHAGRQELFKNGVPTSPINLKSQYFCDNKQLTKRVFADLDIPFPKSVCFKTGREPQLKRMIGNDHLFVAKPLDATNGIGVKLDIETLEGVQNYLQTYGDISEWFILEKQVTGEDLRLQVLGGKLVAACTRKPATVTGNGEDTLQALIDKRKKEIKKQNPNNSLRIDEVTQGLLKQQKIQLSDVPKKGQPVKLKHIANMAQGAIATDVTDEIHSRFHTWVRKLVKYLQTDYLGIDIITTNHRLDPLIHSKILELNAQADWLHHTFSENRTHNMAEMILTTIFKE